MTPDNIRNWSKLPIDNRYNIVIMDTYQTQEIEMSDFLTDRDEITTHDWTPGHYQGLSSYYRERAGRLHTMVCDMQEEDALANGGSGSDAWWVLQSINNELIDGDIAAAANLADENGLTLPGLKELAAEMNQDDRVDAELYHPHQM